MNPLKTLLKISFISKSSNVQYITILSMLLSKSEHSVNGEWSFTHKSWIGQEFVDILLILLNFDIEKCPFPNTDFIPKGSNAFRNTVQQSSNAYILLLIIHYQKQILGFQRGGVSLFHGYSEGSFRCSESLKQGQG